MSETINDRIEMLVNQRFDGNKAAFAKSVGLPPTGLSNYLGKQRRSKPSVDMVTKIITTLKVDALWLLTGKESTGDHFEQHGDRNVQVRKVDNFKMDNRTMLLEGFMEEGKTEYKTEQLILPSDCPDESKHTITRLTDEVRHLKELIAEKDSRIAEKDEIISELRERIKELKSK